MTLIDLQVISNSGTSNPKPAKDGDLIAASNIHLIRNYETFHARMLSADVIQAASSI